MDSQVVKLAEETLGRYDALTQELSDPNIFDDQRRYAGSPKHARMRRGAELSRELLEAIEAGHATGRHPQAERRGGARVFAAEAREAEERIEDLSERIRTELIDRDPNDDKDVIIEIRAGAGGGRAASSPANSRYVHPLRRPPRLRAPRPVVQSGRSRRL